MKETEIAEALINNKDFRNATTAFADNMAQNKELIGKLLPIIDNNPELTNKRNKLIQAIKDASNVAKGGRRRTKKIKTKKQKKSKN
jgi:hypothetical protein